MDNGSQSNYISEPKSESELEDNENNLKNISPFMSKDLIAAAGFNVETPIVSAIIGNLTGSLPTKKSPAEMIRCDICGCELSSIVVLKLHMNGSRHKKRLKALEIMAQLKDAKNKGVNLGDTENPNAFRCEICLLTANSAQQLEIHLSGAKHKKKAARAGFSEYRPSSRKNHELNESSEHTGPPPIKKQKKEDSKIICDICNISVNSRTQYDQHMVSKKHLSKINVEANQPPCA